MRVKLKNINRTRKRLADGSWQTYWYAWKAGPKIRDPRTPEGQADYYAAHAARRNAPSGTLQGIANAYQASAEWARLSDRTQKDYVRQIQAIEAEFADFPLEALTDKRTRGVFKAWRDSLAAKSLRQADYAWTVLARILSWSLDRGLIDANPCERGGRLYHSSRVDRIWTLDDEDAFKTVAAAPLRLAFDLAIWTGQRQGDLLRLPWSAYDGTVIRLRQSKNGARVAVPVGAPLRAALDDEPRRSPIIMTNLQGRPWTPDGFRSSWRKACAKAGISGLTFHDLRGSAITRLALAGATESEIAAVTGHTLHDVRSILDSHYLHRDPALAESAVRKLETHKRRTEIPN